MPFRSPTQLEAVHLAQEGRTPGIAHPDDKDHTGRASPALDSTIPPSIRVFSSESLIASGGQNIGSAYSQIPALALADVPF